MSNHILLAKTAGLRHVASKAMSEFQVIRSALEQAARRRRWAGALRGFCYGLLVGAILSVILVAIYRFYPYGPPLWTLVAAGLVPFPCMLAGAIITGWRKPPLDEVARWIDDRRRLKERLSTALEMSGQNDAGPWRDLIIADAAAHAGDIDPRKLLPFRLPRVTRWAVVILALGAGLGFVPEYRSKAYLQKKADQENIKEVGRQLAELTRRSLAQRPPAMEPTQKSMEKVTALGEQLSKQTLTRSEALKDLASVSEKLKDQLKDMAKDPALRKMEQAARAAGGADAQNPAELQKQIDSLQKQMGTPTGNPDAMDKLKDQLQKLKESAKGMSDPNASTGEAERQKLSDSLSALSKQAQQMGLQLPQLDEAIEALASNQPELVLKDLDAALQDLDKMREMAKSLQQLQQQMEKLGKNLGEQLKFGQPEAAQQTLQKMMSQLQQANLTPEQMEKLMKEVSEAVDPAGKYENVAEHLKEAVKEMQQGDKPGASDQLAKASKELDKLMQQMGDMQELAETLQSLEQAQMCIGSGQGWCANRGMPKAGQGGKPGSGVGTWADDSAEWDGESTAGWDNSGVERADQDGRGLTDRGPGELSDKLSPTKVKGQFQPGAQMPSITLKGVSIKGQSKVAFEEAAATAQSDAQSALSQEKVPRAYQNAVKDYFDDIKK